MVFVKRKSKRGLTNKDMKKMETWGVPFYTPTVISNYK